MNSTREMRIYEVFGGIDYPSSPLLVADHLLVSGWCFSPQARVEGVRVYDGDTLLGEGSFGILSPLVALTYSGQSNSDRAGFRFVAALDTLRLGDPSNGVLHLRVVCQFDNGQEYVMRTNPVVALRRDAVLDRQISTPSRFLGGIEACELLPQRRLRVRGYLFNPTGGSPRFFLCSPRRRLPVNANDPTSQRSVHDDFYPLDAAVSRSAFELEFPAEALGGVPAAFRLIAQVGDEEIVLSNPAMERRIIESIAFMLGETEDRGILPRIAGRFFLPRGRRLRSKTQSTRDRSDRMLVVAHNVSPFEGAPRVLLKLLTEYRRNHPHVSIGVMSLRGDSPSNEVLAFTDRFFSTPQPIIPPYDFNRFAEVVRSVDEVIDEINPDLVLANVIDSFPAVYAAKRRGVKVHWMIHESKAPELSFLDSPPEIQQIYLRSLSTADRLLFVSAATADLYKSIRREKPIAIIANGIDLTAIDSFRSTLSATEARVELGIRDELVVSIIGTVDYRKGQDIFIREMALLRDQLRPRPLKCFVVGCRDGDFLESLRREVSRLQLEDSVSLVRENNRVGVYLQATDILCVCSREESAPLITLEAMGFKKPIVSTAVFGLSEQLQDGSNALIFDPGKAGDLSEKIMGLIQQPSLREQISIEARRSVESRFTFRAQYEAFEQQIRSHLTHRG